MGGRFLRHSDWSRPRRPSREVSLWFSSKKTWTFEPLLAETKERHGFIQLFMWPNLRKKTLICYYLWFSTALIYYGLTLNSNTLGTDLFLTFSIGKVGLIFMSKQTKYVDMWNKMSGPDCLAFLLVGVMGDIIFKVSIFSFSSFHQLRSSYSCYSKLDEE